MLSTWFLQRLFAAALIVMLIAAAAPAAACCGNPPDWFFEAYLQTQPMCSSRSFDGGGVRWYADYRLTTASTTFLNVHVFGDGVITNDQTYTHLPHQAGAAYDTISHTATWYWDPNYTGTRRVKVQFNIWAGSYEDGALIMFECTSRGVQNLEVINVEGWYD